MELTEGFVQLLEGFRPVFQLQTFPIFVELMTGWVLSHRRRFVTDLIVSSGSVGKRHFSDYHRFFSQYVWELDLVSKTLFLLLVRVFAASGIIELAVDDTLARAPRKTTDVATPKTSASGPRQRSKYLQNPKLVVLLYGLVSRRNIFLNHQ